MDMQVKRRFVLSVALSLCALLAVADRGSAGAQDPDQSAWPTREWPTSTPEQQGMDSAALAKLVAFGESHGFDSLLVERHGRIVLDAYYAPYTADIPHQIHSCTKAIISTLVGMTYRDGQLDRLDHPVLDFFAGGNIANVDDRKKAVTVQNLLDMTSGFDWDQGFEGGKEQTLVDQYRSSNWTQFTLDRPMAHAPGEVFNYIDGNPNLISAIITKLTGKLAEDYAREKLFGPLGITNWHWDRDPQGLTMGAWSLTLLPRDMAKIGYLYLHHGEWEGKQLLPAGWADVLDHATVSMHASFDPDLHYSNFFWVFPKEHVFMANGWHGQNIAVFPDLDIVAVVTAHKYVAQSALIEGVDAAVKSGAALPQNRNATETLADAIKDVAVETSTAVGPTSEMASIISGKAYKFPDGDLGLGLGLGLRLQSLTLFLTDPRPHMEVQLYSDHPTIFSGSYDTPIGLDGLYRKGTPAISGYDPGHVPAAKGAWLNGHTFVIDAQDLGYGGQRKYILSFSGKKLNLHLILEHGQDVSVDGEQDD
ncbi:serine hydrolase domain-containing protein [Labrys wisconsinensis]|uniref:CubicO group peptidase (Beta-lactamase class C family) n=1 Tax=Labrys wisconsinensis TaxID=425677 RepID=A0ABU0JCI9_9HYPH|nr:serine hydrolase [Labrys wisconsinensis]MDQ0471998.1 CubicO group peptidase (beta-lactamase class C family) [Labrys wisconsinensis]